MCICNSCKLASTSYKYDYLDHIHDLPEYMGLLELRTTLPGGVEEDEEEIKETKKEGIEGLQVELQKGVFRTEKGVCSVLLFSKDCYRQQYKGVGVIGGQRKGCSKEGSSRVLGRNARVMTKARMMRAAQKKGVVGRASN
jgi:hypothetical protein